MALKVNKYKVIKTILTRTNCLPPKNTSAQVLLPRRACLLTLIEGQGRKTRGDKLQAIRIGN